MFKKRAEDERENGDRLIRACLEEVEHSEAQTSWDHDTETLNVGLQRRAQRCPGVFAIRR